MVTKMKIMKKIQALSDSVSAGNVSLGERIQREAVAAILGGKGSPAWETYMRNFHSNTDQLERLLGNDTQFMNSTWGKLTLAYIAGDGTCGGGTTIGTGRNMPKAMKDHVDNGVSSDVDPTSPLDADLLAFV